MTDVSYLWRIFDSSGSSELTAGNDDWPQQVAN